VAYGGASLCAGARRPAWGEGKQGKSDLDCKSRIAEEYERVMFVSAEGERAVLYFTAGCRQDPGVGVSCRPERKRTGGKR